MQSDIFSFIYNLAIFATVYSSIHIDVQQKTYPSHKDYSMPNFTSLPQDIVLPEIIYKTVEVITGK